MLKVLHAKAEQCAPFRQALIETGDCIIMEGGRDHYWACGLDHRVAITTNVSFMPGDNQLGILLAAVRHSILTLYSPQLFLNILEFFVHGFCLIRVPKRQK